MLLCAIFLFKKKTKNIETKFYTIFLVTNLIGLIIDICLAFASKFMDLNTIQYKLLARSYLVYFITWIALLTAYLYIIVYNKKNLLNEKMPKTYKIYLLIYTFNILFVLISPNYFKQDEYGTHSYGMATSYTYICSSIYILLSIILMFKGKKEQFKKYMPIILFIILLIITMVIQIYNPSIILTPTAMTLTAFIMYFTIENPDVKMINELNKNRELTNKSFMEKSNFLFRVSAEVRKPIENIDKINRVNMESKDLEEIEENSGLIDLNVREASFRLNNVLDVTSLDSKKLNVFKKEKYSIIKLLKEIKLRNSINVKEGVLFRFEISENLPLSLYGDSIKLKQILTTVIENAINNTDKGFIEVSVNSIIKYDVCRLIISVTDSGKGMSLEKINEILKNENDLSDDDIKRLDDMNIGFKVASKVLKLMGGNMMVKSEENKGTEFTIVVDQLLGEESIKNIGNNSDILFVSNDNELLKKLDILFKEYSTCYVMNGIDAIDLIRAGENYNLILIDDVMKPISGLETLKKLRSLDINIPCIIMLDKDKEHIKNHYIKDGFIDYILKDDLKNEINRIIKRIL